MDNGNQKKTTLSVESKKLILMMMAEDMFYQMQVMVRE